MQAPTQIPEEAIREELKTLPGWEYSAEERKLKRELPFKNFTDSLDFVNKAAPWFQANDHHPDICIMYDRIRFELQRFDAGGVVTDRDILTARMIEDLYKKRDTSKPTART